MTDKESNSTKVNPYTLVYWRCDWSEGKTKKNNTKYWKWEFKNGTLKNDR